MTPLQNCKSAHKGFSLAELTAAAVIMVGIWLGALAYMNAASEEFEEAKEEALAQAPEEDIAILTEIRAAESALVASEALTEEAREAWEAARREAVEEAARTKPYRDLLNEVIDIMAGGGDIGTRLQQHRDIHYVVWNTGSGRYRMVLKGNWLKDRSEMKQLCKNMLKIRGKGWSCQIVNSSEIEPDYAHYGPWGIIITK